MVKQTRASSRSNKSRTRKNKRGGSSTPIPPEELQIYNRVANGTTWNEVLGVGKDATVENIKKEFRKLGPYIHPEGKLSKQFLTNKTSTELFARASDAFSWRTQCEPGCKTWKASPVDISSIANFQKPKEAQQSKAAPKPKEEKGKDKESIQKQRVVILRRIMDSAEDNGWAVICKDPGPGWEGTHCKFKLAPDSAYARDEILSDYPYEFPKWNRKERLRRKDPLPFIPPAWRGKTNKWIDDGSGIWVYKLNHTNGSVLYIGGAHGVITKWPIFIDQFDRKEVRLTVAPVAKEAHEAELRRLKKDKQVSAAQFEKIKHYYSIAESAEDNGWVVVCRDPGPGWEGSHCKFKLDPDSEYARDEILTN